MVVFSPPLSEYVPGAADGVEMRRGECVGEVCLSVARVGSARPTCLLECRGWGRGGGFEKESRGFFGRETFSVVSASLKASFDVL